MKNSEAAHVLKNAAFLASERTGIIVQKAVEMAVNALEKTQWIPVTERLPKPNELDGNVTRFYLVQNEYGDMMVASFNKSSASECTWWEQIYQYGEELSDIVAWMPLPEPWKGESDVGNQK